MSFADFKLIGINRFPTSLYMWGDNTNGLLGDNRTPSYFSWSKISSGGLHTVAIRSDGTLFAWGRNTEFQLGDTTTIHRSSPVQIGTSSWVAVSAGTSHTVAIKGDSTLWSWGANRYGQLGLGDTANRSSPVQVGTSSYIAVSSGGNHSLAINLDNSIWTWGLNNSGQLGDSTINSKLSPVQVTTATPLTNSNAHSVYNSSVTSYLSLASNTAFDFGTGNFTIECWFNTSTIATTQVLIDRWNFGTTNFLLRLLTDQVQAYAVGGSSSVNSGAVRIVVNTWYHVAFVRSGTTLTLYLNGVSVGIPVTEAGSISGSTVVGIGGRATEGLVGYISNARIVKGTAVYTSAFTPSTTPLTAISGTSLLTAQNTTIIDNSTNAFTITNIGGVTTSINTPFRNVFLTGTNLSVSAGKSHSTAITTDNKLYAWGDNTYGELGDSTTINRSSPVQIGTSSWSQISAGGTHTVGIESDGSLLAWGYNNYGQLGLNTPYSGTYWTQVSEGPTHTLAIRNDGALFVWGRNNLGQLGTSDTVDRSSPVQIGTSSWASVNAGSSHSTAIRSDNKLFTWGANDYGQLGNNLDVTTIATNITWSKIAMGGSASHALAIKNDGTLWGWGLNTSGQLGDGTAINKSSPVQVGALNTWIDVAAGSVHSLGITNDNVLYTWGTNTFGQLGDNTAGAKSSPIVVGFNYKKVFAGYQTSIAIDNNNYTYIWGDNANGLIPGGVVGTHRSSIALLNSDITWSSFAIDRHILGIKTNGSLWSWGLGTTGQLGLNDLLSRSSPTQIGTRSWSMVSAGTSHSMGITVDNTLYAWGGNSEGQLGLSDTVNRSAPATVGLAEGLTDLNAYSTFFSGSATFLTIPKEAITMSSSGSTTNPTYTVECWYNRTGGGYHSILATSGSTSPTFNFMVDNTRRISLNVAGTNTDGPTILSLNRWYHIALTRNPTGVSNNAVFNVYLNGVLEFTMNDSDPMRNVEPYCIANDFTHGASQYLAGYLSNYRISNKIVYTGNFTVPVSPLELTQLSDTNISSLTAGEVKFLSLQTSTTSPVDISTNAYVITVSGTITSSTLTPFTDYIGTGTTLVTNIVVGSFHSMFIDNNGNLYAIGYNAFGGLGLNDQLARSSPVQVGTDTYQQIFAGTFFSFGLKTNYTLWSWGSNPNGQLADGTIISKSSPIAVGTTLSNQSSPVQIGNSSYSQVSAGAGHTLGLGYDGILYGWGKNDQGQIGGQLNTLGIGWSKVVVGPTHSLGIRFDGTLYAWGNNASGQLGDRTIVAKSSPVVVDSINNWKDIAVGQGTLYYSLAIRNDGKLFAWGNNQGGQLGWISWRQVSVGSGHSLLLRSDGALYTMGTNTAGQLGDATTVNKSSPVLIGTSSWNFVNAGISVSAAIDSVGRLFTWGFNNVGQLGLATTANRSSPVQVSAGSWSQVASEDYMLAITTQGSIWSWGNNNNGQLGLGTTVNSKVPKLLDGTTTSYSIGFDGIGDYLTIPTNAAFVFGTGNFTIEWWWYLSVPFANASGPGIGQKLNDTTGGWVIYRNTTINTTVLSLRLAGQGGAGNLDYVSTVTPTQSVWQHWAVVRNGTTVTWYCNGVASGSTAGVSTNITDTNVTAPMYVGFSQTWGYYTHNSYISNLRVVKGQALYTAKFTPSTSPLTTTSQGISSGTVSLLTAQNAAIIDNSGNGFAITAIGTPTVTQYNPFSVISSTSSTSWTNVAAGTHSLAIKSDSTLYAWGLNSTGQLGDSTTINKSSPIQIGSSSWSFISASMTGHSLGIEVDGALFAWGRNTYGELGVNNEFFDVSSPVQIMSSLSFTAVSAGNNASLAMATENNINTLYGWGLNNENQLNNVSPFVWLSLNEGTGIYANLGSTVGKLYLWGNNTYGQLGDNTVVARSSPTQLGGFLGSNTYKYIVNNPLNTAYINVDNTLYMMGDNTYGQLGQGDTINRSSPVQIGTGTWSTVVISGSGHVLAISSNGTLFTWGNNTYNELGQSDLVVVNRSSPVTVGTNANWTKISVGNNYSIAINDTGAMYAWGRNDWGQLGTIVPLSYTNIGAGIASRNDGKLYTWGTNTPYGQVGDGTTINRSAPTQISGVTLASISWTSVSGSLNNRASIRINSTLWAWGDNTYGQLGQVDTIPRSNPVQIGISSWTQVYVNSDNIFAIRSDGKLFSWGNNNVGQLGTGDTINYSSPVQIGSDSWNQIVASTTGHALGIKTDGTLYAWGNNQFNELGQNQRVQLAYSSPVQVGTSSWTKIGAGNNNSFAIRTDGSLWGWGRNDFGQIGTNNNTPLSWTSVAGGDSYSVAIRSDGKLFSWGRNDKGQLGLGHTVNKSAPTQIAVSNNYNLYSTFFNGSTDFLTITNNAAFALGAGDFTVECWFYTNTITAAQNHIFDTRTSATGSTNPNLYMTNDIMRWLINGTSILTGTIPLATWTHIAVVKNSGTIAMYINGVRTSSVADSVTYTSAQFQIGKAWDGFYCNGYISNFRMVKGTAVYTGNFIVPTSPLTNITNTSLLTCQNSIFIDNGTANTGSTPFTITQNGTGITTTTNTPFQTTVYNYSWTQVSATLSHTVAIRNDGTLWAWGDNSAGQLSQDDTANRSAPTQIGSSSWTSISAGRNATYAIRTDNALFSVGDNTYGQLGQADNLNRSTLLQVGSSSWTILSASQTGHVLGILSTGALYAWGNNSYNELGLVSDINSAFNPYTLHRSSPIQVGTSSWTKVSAGNNFSLAIRTDSTLWAWGLNESGQSGIISNVSFTGIAQSAIIRSDGKMFAWGSSGTIGGGGDRSNPTQVGGGNSWTTISSIDGFTGRYAIRQDGLLFDSITSANPLQLSGTTYSWIALSSSPLNQYVLAVRSDYTVWSWGGNTKGELGQGTVGAGTTGQVILPAKSWTNVAAGYSHGLFLASDGTLYSTGQNGDGELGDGTTINKSTPVQVAPGTSWSAVSAGNRSSIAIKSDFTLYTWGFNSFGQLGIGATTTRSSPVQVGTSSWSVISAGSQVMYAIDILGKLYSWGSNVYGELGGSSTLAIGAGVTRSAPVQIGPAGISFTQVRAYGYSTAYNATAFTTGKLVYTWGYNGYGNLGDGTTINRSAPVQIGTTLLKMQEIYKSPTQVGALTTWSQIQAGNSWSAATSTTGALFMWGSSTNYELGVGTTAARSSPVQLGALLYSTLSGTRNPLAIQTTTGNLYGWGIQAAGQLGLGDTALRSSPVQIASLTGQVFDNVSSPTQIGSSSWTQVAAGDLFTNALRAVDGGLFTWGYGINGRLGSGATASRSSPVQVGTSSWIAISTGGTENTVALTIAYTLFSWGRNNTGQVGDATTVDKSAPAAVGAALNTNLMTSVIKTVTQVGTSSWTQISAGDFHAYAIRTGGGLFAWGKNDQGQLGLSIATTIHRSSPVQIGAGTWSVISAGNSFGAAITTAGNLQTTGLNNNGQQGAGTTVGRSAFTSVGSSSWTAVTAGASSMIGTSISNITFVWGTNTAGQLGLGDTANRSAPTQLGSNLAGSMYQTVYPSPVTVSTFTTASWTQVNVGDSFSVGIDNSGRLYSWGRNNTGQLGNGTTINTMPTKSSPTQIATTASSFTFINTSSPVQVSTGTSWNSVVAGGTHTVAIKSDGTLWAWGLNTFGQVGTISTLNQYVPKQIDILNSFTNLAAGSDFSVALKDDKTLWRWGFNTSTDISSPHRSNPLQLGSDSWNVISAAGNTAVAINSLGKLYGWGKITTDDNFLFNLPVDPITWAVNKSYTNVNAGDSFIHAIDTRYELWGYGLNNIGQLGDSTTITRSSPVQIGSVYNWSIIGGGIGATPMHAGALYLTGLNSSGQLGLGDVAFRSSPVQLPATNQPLFNFPVRIGISRWSQISAGYSHSMAIRDDNTLWGWGLNASGQLGDGTIISKSSPIAVGTSSWIAISAGASHTSAIKLGDTLWSWGLNTRGQLGDNTTVNKSSPVQVGTGYWNNVTAGASHTTALADNNTLYIWGDDNFGQ